jgi:hypothetical protein
MARTKQRRTGKTAARRAPKRASRTARTARTFALAATAAPLPYLAISAAIVPTHPDAAEAREELIQRIDLEPHQWATADTVVVQVQSNAQLNHLLDALEDLNDRFEPFAAIAFLVPHKQLWFLSDQPSNLPAIVDITGRQPR